MFKEELPLSSSRKAAVPDPSDAMRVADHPIFKVETLVKDRTDDMTVTAGGPRKAGASRLRSRLDLSRDQSRSSEEGVLVEII